MSLTPQRTALLPVSGIGSVPAEMMAAVITSPRAAALRSVPTPEPRSRELLVRILGCGICGSNLPVWKGEPWFTYPFPAGAPGHEAWGVVESAGAEVDDFQPGDRVALLGERSFAQYETTAASKALLIPREVGDVPFPGEPLACAVNVANRSSIAPGESVAIVGIGFLGALLTQLCKARGATITAIGRRACALEMAKRFGAARTIKWEEAGDNPAACLNGSSGFDCVIEAVGTQEALDLASRLTKTRGRLVIAGYHQDGPRTVDMQMWNWKGLDVINAHERDSRVYVEGMRQALAMIRSGTLVPAPLYTHVFPLSDIELAFETLRNRPAGFMKALVMP